MRASRLVELLLLLQARGRVPAPELARQLEVSVRTVYRDVLALSAAGVPVFTETGRNGGVCLAEGYRAGGLPRSSDSEIRGMLLAALPAVAGDLGVAHEAGERALLSAMDGGGASTARSVRERLLIEAEPWWHERAEVPHLLTVAEALWSSQLVRLTYERPDGSPPTDVTVRPLGLVLKAGTWYVVARRTTGDVDRIYRVSRVRDAERLAQRFERPLGFDLARAWSARKEAFGRSIPRFEATVRISPMIREDLQALHEATPSAPLPVADSDGWTTVDLTFEQPDAPVGRLLQLGADIEVVAPPALREAMREAVAELVARYAR